MRRISLGIDPGQQGGFAWVGDIEPAAFIMPLAGSEVDVPAFAAVLRALVGMGTDVKVVCTLEWAQAMPKQGVTGVFSYGEGFGMLRGVLGTLEIPYHRVRPTAWKKRILAGTAKDKDAAIEFVRAAYPTLNLMRTAACKKPHDGMADAVCLASYGWREYFGGAS